MSLIGLIILLALVGLALYLVDRFVPMDRTVKNIIHVVVIVALIIYLLQAFGLFTGLRI